MLAAASAQTALTFTPQRPTLAPWSLWLRRAGATGLLEPTASKASRPTPTLDVPVTVQTPVPNQAGQTPVPQVVPVPVGPGAWLDHPLTQVGGTTITNGIALGLGALLLALVLAAKR